GRVLGRRRRPVRGRGPACVRSCCTARGMAPGVPLLLRRPLPDPESPGEGTAVRACARVLPERDEPGRSSTAERGRSVRRPPGRRARGALLRRSTPWSRAAARRDGLGRYRYVEGGDVRADGGALPLE